jgi:hypothetical protein
MWDRVWFWSCLVSACVFSVLALVCIAVVAAIAVLPTDIPLIALWEPIVTAVGCLLVAAYDWRQWLRLPRQ